jgi:Icc-related predicted phosphoesterase
MRFAFLSDLHLDHCPIDIPSLGVDDATVDFAIIAGDLHPKDQRRDRFLIDFELYINAPVIFVPGNHDYWGPTPSQKATLTKTITVGGEHCQIAGATLWTYLTPSQWLLYLHGLADCRFIENWWEDNYLMAHRIQKDWLMKSKADIIVSHHAPSKRSVSENFMHHPLNCAFVNSMDGEILNLEKPPKFWIHGHVHQSFDYMIGKTRVLCHPRGYPHESNFNNYKARIIDFDSE